MGTGFSEGAFSSEVFGGVAAFAFSLSLAACAVAFDFEGFDEPPIRLLNIPHLPLAGSSSGKSVESVASAATF